MRYLIFSDIHSNLEALQAVLSAVETFDVDKYVFLGDAVGYAANPKEVVEVLMSLNPLVAIRGNHDKVGAGIEEGENFNEIARFAALWSRDQLSPKTKPFVIQLPRGPLVVDDSFVISHGSPKDEDMYLFSKWEAQRVLHDSDFGLTFFGHTHVPVMYVEDGPDIKIIKPTEDIFRCVLSEERKYLVNPGAVGQPRDENPKASFALLDTNTKLLKIRRVPYDIATAQAKIRHAGLPALIGDRLGFGK